MISVLGKTVTAVLILLFFFTTRSTAAIKSIKIQSDNRPVILFHKFGFTNTGNLSITISNVSISTDSLYDPSLIGFYLLSDATLIQLLQQSPTFCLMDLMSVSLFFTFRDISPSQSSYHNWYPVTNPNEYALFYVNCNPQTLVTMNVRTELYNNEDGATKNYLSSGLTQLPSLYFIFSILYLCFLGCWFSVCFKNQRSVHQIHLLMSLLLIFKAHSMFCAAGDEYYVKVTGDPNGWNILFYIFQFINSMLLFTVIILIGAGWSYLKPFLQAKEKIVLIIVILFQVLANVASIVIDENGPYSKDWVTWNQVFMWSNAICDCAIFFPVGWSITSLNELSKTDEKAGRNLTLFVRFYRLVFGYFIFMRIGVFALMTNIATYEYKWVSIAVEAAANLVFYFVMFYMFRPVEKSEYVVVEYKEAAGMAKGRRM